MRIYSLFILLCINFSLFSIEMNEKLIFNIKYGVIKAGEATLEIEESVFKDSIPVYKIKSLAKTNSFFDKIYKVRDYIESIWDKEELITLRFTKKLREGSYRQHRIHYYYPDQRLTMYVKFSNKSSEIKQKKSEIPINTQDILSAFYWFRKQDLKIGGDYKVNITTDGRNYPARIIVHRKEKIKSIFGKVECFVVEPVLEGEALFKQTGKILIWLTADEKKIPVKMSSKIIFGSFKANLKKVEYGFNK